MSMINNLSVHNYKSDYDLEKEYDLGSKDIAINGNLQLPVLFITAKLAGRAPLHAPSWWNFDWVRCNFQDTSRKVFKTSGYVAQIRALFWISLFWDYPGSSDQKI